MAKRKRRSTRKGPIVVSMKAPRSRKSTSRRRSSTALASRRPRSAAKLARKQPRRRTSTTRTRRKNPAISFKKVAMTGAVLVGGVFAGQWIMGQLDTLVFNKLNLDPKMRGAVKLGGTLGVLALGEYVEQARLVKDVDVSPLFLALAVFMAKDGLDDLGVGTPGTAGTFYRPNMGATFQPVHSRMQGSLMMDRESLGTQGMSAAPPSRMQGYGSRRAPSIL